MADKKSTKITKLCLDWEKIKTIGNCVVPVVVQDFTTREVLILAYANEEALSKTMNTKIATFWSTSRNKLWIKGDESGNKLKIVEVRINCEQNSLLYLVRPVNHCGACHVKNEIGEYYSGCYYRSLDSENGNFFLRFID